MALIGIVLTSPVVVFLGVAIIFVRLLAEVWPRRVLESLEYHHSLSPTRTVVGEEVDLTLSVWNRSRFPVAWVSTRDGVATGLRLVGNRALIQELGMSGPMRPFERLTRRVKVVPIKRGVHEIGPARVSVSEIFGSQDPQTETGLEAARVIARPYTAPVRGTLDASSPLAQVRARSSLFVDPTLFAGTRPFQVGDPVRSIHWRASARQPGLQAKRYEPALSRQAILVFDVQTVEGAYWMLEYDEQLFEDQCVVAASVARSFVADATALGLAAAGFVGQVHRFVFVPPRADHSQIGRIGDALARLGVESSAPLTSLLAWLPRRVPRGSSLIVVTGRDPVPTTAIARRLARSGLSVHYLLMPPAHEFVAQARAAGLSVSAVRVERDRGAKELPSAVVIAA